MNKDLQRSISIPEGVEVTIDKQTITVKGKEKESKKTFNVRGITIEKKNGEIILSAKKATRRQSKMMGTIWAHLNNMIKGVQEEFIYQLEICNVHFPMNVKKEGDKIIIKSFLGETTQRQSKILPDVKVEISGSQITVSSHDIEAAGQTAANLEKATKAKGRDRRIFQDGIYITHKNGRQI